MPQERQQRRRDIEMRGDGLDPRGAAEARREDDERHMVAVDPRGRWNLRKPVIPGDDEDRVAVGGELRLLLEVGPERRVRVEDRRVDLPILAGGCPLPPRGEGPPPAVPPEGAGTLLGRAR